MIVKFTFRDRKGTVHAGRYLLALALQSAGAVVLAGVLAWAFNPPYWVLVGFVFALGLVTPTPKWAYLAMKPVICPNCAKGHHVHDMNSGTCITKTCECGGAS